MRRDLPGSPLLGISGWFPAIPAAAFMVGVGSGAGAAAPTFCWRGARPEPLPLLLAPLELAHEPVVKP